MKNQTLSLDVLSGPSAGWHLDQTDGTWSGYLMAAIGLAFAFGADQVRRQAIP
jgi:hypothetical protein